MCHEPRRGRAVPVLLPRFEEDAVAGPDDLDRTTAPLRQAHTLEHVDRLTVRVRVPRRTRACVKWTLLALRTDAPARDATESMYTAPVNQSLGPAVVSLRSS
jgi:hypothetical protein